MKRSKQRRTRSLKALSTQMVSEICMYSAAINEGESAKSGFKYGSNLHQCIYCLSAHCSSDDCIATINIKVLASQVL